MNETFNLKFAQGHPIITIDEKTFVVDTGSPASFSYSGSIALCSRHHRVPYGNYILDSLNRVLQTRIDGLIGGDLMKRLGAVEIDYPNSTITFHETLPDVTGASEYDMSVFCNYLIFNTTIDNQPRRVVLDTGAPIPYLCSHILPHRAPDSFVEDVTPSGTFSSPVYSMETEMAGKKFKVNYGKLPMAHQVMVKIMQCDGVVGKDIFDLGTVIISYRQGKMYLKF